MRGMVWGALVALMMGSGMARADAPSADAPSAESPAARREAESDAAERAAVAAATKGPAKVTLADQAVLSLPEGWRWVPPAEGQRLMRSWGNVTDDSLLGLVLGRTGTRTWVAPVTLTRDGYVKDDDAKDLNAEELFSQIKEADQEGNKQRVERGFPPIETGRWLEPPRYDAARKRLVWAMPIYDESADPSTATVNYNTRALGRDGYLSLNLLSDPEHFAADKPGAETMLAAVGYVPGKRYEDFNGSTDRVAEYGLAALIGAVALKKLGLLALGTAFVLKFAKLGILAVVGAGAGIRRLLRGRNRAA